MRKLEAGSRGWGEDSVGSCVRADRGLFSGALSWQVEPLFYFLNSVLGKAAGFFVVAAGGGFFLHRLRNERLFVD